MSVVAAQGAASGHSTTVSGAAVVSPSKLKLAHLETAACRFFASGLADSTRKAYASGQARYLKILQSFFLHPSFHIRAPPMFVCLTPSRRRSLSQNYQKLPVSSAPPTDPVGFGRPIHRYSRTTSLCLERIRRQRGPRLKVDKRLPITAAELKILKDVWAKRSPFYNAAMLWAAVCTGFFGFMRAGEFTVSSVAAFDSSVHLAPQNVSIDSHVTPSVMRIHLKQSKTDPFR